MERNKQHQLLNSDFRTALFLWQGSSESYNAVKKMGDLLTMARRTGADLTFRISKEIMNVDESRRAISLEDLKKYAKTEGNFFVFNLYVRKGSEGSARMKVIDFWRNQPDRGIIDRYNFVFEARSGDGWTTVGVFKPHEIESFIVGGPYRGEI